MARLVTSGFEIQFVNDALAAGSPDGSWDGIGTGSRATTGQRSGAACFRTNPTNVNTSVTWSFTGVLDRTYWARIYLRISTLPTATAGIILFSTATSNAQLTTTGTVRASQNTAVASSAINDGNWHRIEYMIKASATQASRAWELRVDGTTISSGTNQTTDAAAPTAMKVGLVTGNPSGDIYFDDVALNDDQGSSQNSWPGSGAVALLIPTADSAIGTGWVGGGGATSSLFGAVDSTPPVGVADTGTNSSQIRNATASANTNYDATMQTYTVAGVPSGSTINVVEPLVATAAPVSTAAKLGTLGVVSNPAITNVNLAAGGTSGAFWSGVAAGTFPSGWKWSHGTTTYAPSVTLGTAPVMRITQVTSSTRIADVCFMGIHVDYTASGANTYTKAGYGNESA